jgi:YidC/Oxa1 family membrane protein insertase
VAGTDTVAPPPYATQDSVVATTAAPSESFVADNPPEILDLPAKTDIPPLEYGDLSELGLVSWTPAGLVRWSLELVQVTTGMPWFHTIVATTLLFRIFLVPISIKALRNSARLLPMTPRLMAIKDEMAAARQSGDMLAMQRVALKQKKIYEDAGVSMGPMLLSPLIQLPVTLGLFFGIKKMCTLPVEQLKHSGLAILPDLTVPDPYFILPILATALINLQISVSSVEVPGCRSIQ